MEDLGLKLFNNIYKDKTVALTGHTGFKGSWLTLWLKKLGAEVAGLSIEPISNPSHWELLNLDIFEKKTDIRNLREVKEFISNTKPQILFHLAAQPLVRSSYLDPLETWSTNVMGTANVLEACREEPNIKAIVIITSDKCYENKEISIGYKEIDHLGGHDPYSSSKAATELLVSSYRKSFFNKSDSPLVSTVRAGNVIGGGDWSEDRLIPDLMRAINEKKTLEIRSPNATRPWQHVLESLSGYLILGQKLLEGNYDFAQPWNFGPNDDGNRTVEEVLESLKEVLPEINWYVTQASQPHEANLLHLDSSKARKKLEWKPVWTIEEGIIETANWYKALFEKNMVLSTAQLDAYVKKAQDRGLNWSRFESS